MSCISFKWSAVSWLKIGHQDSRPSNSHQGPNSIKICRLTSIGIPIIKIRWSHDCLIFIMEIPIPGRTVFILRWGPVPFPWLLPYFAIHHKFPWLYPDPGHYVLLRSRQNGRRFADDIFKYIFLNESVIISAKISLKFVPIVPINYIPALVQIMAWRRPGIKPLSEPVMVRLPTHICVTRPQWVISI